MYRWFNVKIEHDEDGAVSVLFEGRGEFPFGERVEVAEGEKVTVHGYIEQGDLSEQPDDVEWYMKKMDRNS